MWVHMVMNQWQTMMVHDEPELGAKMNAMGGEVRSGDEGGILHMA
jgi:hypothetical protein